MRKAFGIGVCAFAALLALIGSSPSVAEQPTAVSQHPDFDDHGGGTWSPNNRGITLLSWDDGSYESGLGFFSGSGQAAMRFGGAAATTGAVPLAIRGAYWRLYPGFAVNNININFFNPLTAGGFPTGPPILQVPGTTATAGTNFVSTPAGPTIGSANGSVMVGVGIQNAASWFIAGDTNGVDNARHFLGGSNTTNLTYGPGTLSGFGFAWNFLIRLLIDGNIPVELQSFSVQK
jgi:hypothetical protein